MIRSKICLLRRSGISIEFIKQITSQKLCLAQLHLDIARGMTGTNVWSSTESSKRDIGHAPSTVQAVEMEDELAKPELDPHATSRSPTSDNTSSSPDRTRIMIGYHFGCVILLLLSYFLSQYDKSVPPARIRRIPAAESPFQVHHLVLSDRDHRRSLNLLRRLRHPDRIWHQCSVVLYSVSHHETRQKLNALTVSP